MAQTLQNEDLGHLTRKRTRPAEMLIKGKENTEWIADKSGSKCQL